MHTVRTVVGKLRKELAAEGTFQMDFEDNIDAILVSLVLLLLFNCQSVHNS